MLSLSLRADQCFKIGMASGRCQPAGTSKNPRVYTLGSPRDIADDAAHITQIEKLSSPEAKGTQAYRKWSE